MSSRRTNKYELTGNILRLYKNTNEADSYLTSFKQTPIFNKKILS